MSSSEKTEILWHGFSSGLKSFIYSKVKNIADTEDILQNVYLKLHDNLHSLKDESRIKPWIYQITRNMIIDHFRADNRNLNINELKSELKSTHSSGKFMDIAISDMIRMMDELSPEYCEALCLTEIDGMSQKEYAQMMGLSYSGAKSRVQRARLMLRDMLLKCCHYQFDKYGTVFDIQPKCWCCCSP
jgi:RNA polymerase sigma-70 factor (ECF subfamily)